MKFIIFAILSICSQIVLAADAEIFSKLPVFSQPQLSPDGKSLAYATYIEGKPVIVTRMLQKQDKTHPVGAIPLHGLHLQWFEWVNNERLIVAVRLSSGKSSYNAGVYRIRKGAGNFIRLFSVDRGGQNIVDFEMKSNKWGIKLPTPDLISVIENDPNFVAVRNQA